MFEKHTILDLNNTEKKLSSDVAEEGKFFVGDKVLEYFKKYLPKQIIEIFSKKKFSFHEKNNELEYETFMRSSKNILGFESVESEILISFDINKILHELGKVEIKNIIRGEVEAIAKDPYGEKSIDLVLKDAEKNHPNNVDIYKQQRSVNEIPLLEKKLDMHVAVKGVANLPYGHENREDLPKQFHFMKQKKKEWQNVPEYIKEIIGINEVYAAVKYKIKDKGKEDGGEIKNKEKENPHKIKDKIKKYEEWLFIERIENASHVKDCRIDHNFFAPKIWGFEIEKHPLLAKIIETELKDSDFEKVISRDGEVCYLWSDFKKALAKVGLNLSDAIGRNILVSKDGYYTIIDQREK